MKKLYYREAGRAQMGMTLIEIMVVITILGLIASVVGVAVLKQLDKAKVSTTCTQIANIANALKLYKIEFGDYPDTSEGLEVLIKEGKLEGNVVPRDPWGREFIYVYPGTHNPDSFDLYSLGADGREGGTGINADINNWGPPCIKTE